MQAFFWNTIAITNTRRVFCFVLAIFAVLFALLANVDHGFELVSYHGARAKMSQAFIYMAMLCIANVIGYYRR